MALERRLTKIAYGAIAFGCIGIAISLIRRKLL